MDNNSDNFKIETKDKKIDNSYLKLLKNIFGKEKSFLGKKRSLISDDLNFLIINVSKIKMIQMRKYLIY